MAPQSVYTFYSDWDKHLKIGRRDEFTATPWHWGDPDSDSRSESGGVGGDSKTASSEADMSS